MKRTLFAMAAGVLSTTICGSTMAGHVQSNVATDFATLTRSLEDRIGLNVDQTIELAEYCRPYRRSYHRPYYGGGYGSRSYYRPRSFHYPRPYHRHHHHYGHGGGVGLYGHRGGFWISF